MKKYIFRCILGIFLGACFLSFAWTSEKKLYPVYDTLYDYQRLTPELFPSSYSLKISAVGHNLSYADMMWIRLIQFVGDNTGNGKYLDFSHHILTNITDLSPNFVKAYETDLIFTPLIYAAEKEDITEDERQKIERAIEHGKDGMKHLCDAKKIEEISKIPYGVNLWSRVDLRNPCTWGKIPYYVGTRYANDLEDNKNASYYLKIASMQDDAPKASRFLGQIAFANTADPIDAAISFFLTAQEGYDAEPFECRKVVHALLWKIWENRIFTSTGITTIMEIEKNIKTEKDIKTPEAYESNNCPDNLRRGIKQIYRSYITNAAAPYPDITNARDLVDKKIIPFIPTLKSQAGFTLRKIKGIWKFTSY